MPTSQQLPIVLGITGASGAVYAARTLEWLLVEGRKVHLVVSSDGLTVIGQELGFFGPVTVKTAVEFITAGHRLVNDGGNADGTDQQSVLSVAKAIESGLLQVHESNDYFCPVASGSYRTEAMIVCPCSGTTMASIAHANGRNLIHRAAEVHLKERRKLVLVPRETPLSSIQIENMLKVTQAGAVVLPAAPGWYHGVHGLRDIVDFVAARILDQIGVEHNRVRRWQS
jgi:4-hydroxy-3-polyprenylbenzoate decarboxylase